MAGTIHSQHTCGLYTQLLVLWQFDLTDNLNSTTTLTQNGSVTHSHETAVFSAKAESEVERLD